MTKLKLVVSYNSEAKTIFVNRCITYTELKARIKNLVPNDVVSGSQFSLSLSYVYEFCDGGEKENEAKVGYIRCDDDVRRMIREFELVESLGRSCRILVFACNGESDVCLNSLCGVKNCEEELWGGYGGLREDLGTQLSGSEKDWNFVDESLTRFCKSELEILENELDEFECCDGRVVDLCGSDDDSDLSFREKSLELCSGLKSDVVGKEKFGKDLVPLMDSGKKKLEEGSSCVDENGKFVKLSSVPVDGSWGQGGLILDSEYGTISESSEAMKVLGSTISNGTDDEHSKSGITSFAASDSSLGFNTEKEIKSREGMQSSHQSDLSINRKEQDEDVSANLNAFDRISAKVDSCYNHLESIELQAVKYSDLEFVKKLGEGAYGIVYYGKWKGSDVAIKRVKLNCSTEGTTSEDKLVKDFWKEAHILGRLHHPNIVALFGVVTDGPPKYLAAVTEYMVNGSLKQVLQKRDRTIDRRKRVIIARDAALGMEYLHENNIIHFDLKSHNLLVNMRDPQRPVCKIGDLGLAKVKQRPLVSGCFRGTLPWMAPELFDTKSMVTEKVDVYSFGIVMWELLTGETPYGNMRSKEILGMIEGDVRPEIPSWCDPVWRSLMERCWSSDPLNRPSFIEIAKELRAMAKSMNIK